MRKQSNNMKKQSSNNRKPSNSNNKLSKSNLTTSPYSQFSSPTLNTSSLLTKRNPFCHFLLLSLFTNIANSDVWRVFSILQATMKRVNKKGRSNKLKFCHPQNARKRSARNVLARRILNDLIPVVSGRDYRVMLTTELELYRRYCTEVAKVGTANNGTHRLLSNTAIKGILKKWKMHHSTDALQCLICKLLKNYGNGQPPPRGLEGQTLTKWNKKLNKHRNHNEIAQTQHSAHKQLKEALINNKQAHLAIALQDFTQLQPQTGFN